MREFILMLAPHLWQAFLIAGLVWAVPRVRLLLGGMKAEGAVVGCVPVGSGSAHANAYVREVRFRADNGRVYEFRDWRGTSDPQWQAGHNVVVIYDPANPDRASVFEFVSLFYMPVILLIIAGLSFWQLGS